MNNIMQQKLFHMVLEAICCRCWDIMIVNSRWQCPISNHTNPNSTASFLNMHVISIVCQIWISASHTDSKPVDLTAPLHSLDDAFLGLQHEVAVVRPLVGEVHLERGERLEGLGVFSLQLLGHVEAVHHLALPSFLGLADAVQNLDLHMPHKCPFYNSLTTWELNASSWSNLIKAAHKCISDTVSV